MRGRRAIRGWEGEAYADWRMRETSPLRDRVAELAALESKLTATLDIVERAGAPTDAILKRLESVRRERALTEAALTDRDVSAERFLSRPSREAEVAEHNRRAAELRRERQLAAIRRYCGEEVYREVTEEPPEATERRIRERARSAWNRGRQLVMKSEAVSFDTYGRGEMLGGPRVVEFPPDARVKVGLGAEYDFRWIAPFGRGMIYRKPRRLQMAGD